MTSETKTAWMLQLGVNNGVRELPSGTDSTDSRAGGARPPSRSRLRWPIGSDRAHPFFSAVLLVLAAFAARYALDPLLLNRSPLLIFTAAIVIAAGRYGAAPGLLAMILSLVLGTVAFMGPGFPPELLPDDIASIGVFIVTSGAMLSFASHLKALREREAQLQAELSQVQTNTAMGTMAATLAHELNQPLAAATNYIGAGKRIAAGLKGKARATLISGLDEAELQIHRAGEIIRQARSLVSNPSRARSEASLRTMVANAQKPLVAGGACDNLQLRLEIEPDADLLEVNEIQIEQVLLNVIRNACQACAPDQAARVVVSAWVDGSDAMIEVRDFGPGIESEKISSLFRAGGASRNGGQGLGLSISRTIVEAHGGRMWAQNAEEGGASFFFTLPRTRQKP